MNELIIIIIAVFLLIPTFALGIVLFIKSLTGEFIAKSVILIHGWLACCSLLLIYLYLLLGHWTAGLKSGAVVLTTAALMGLSLVKLQLKPNTRTALIIIHPIFAIVGIIFLIVSVLT